MITGSAFNMTCPDFSFVPVNHCVCVTPPPFFFLVVASIFDMFFFSGILKKDNILITAMLGNVNDDACQVTISRGFCSLPCPPPCLLALASSPSPSSHFLPRSKLCRRLFQPVPSERGGRGPGE